jgi:hypothetical protein
MHQAEESRKKEISDDPTSKGRSFCIALLPGAIIRGEEVLSQDEQHQKDE